MPGSEFYLARSGRGKTLGSRVLQMQIMRQLSRFARVQHLVLAEMLMSERPYVLSGHATLPEPSLLFDNAQTDTHPLRGLTNYGPYSAGLGFPTQVRLAYFFPVLFNTSQKNETGDRERNS